MLFIEIHTNNKKSFEDIKEIVINALKEVDSNESDIKANYCGQHTISKHMTNPTTPNGKFVHIVKLHDTNPLVSRYFVIAEKIIKHNIRVFDSNGRFYPAVSEVGAIEVDDNTITEF